MKKIILAFCLTLGAAMSATAAPNILSVTESLSDSTMVIPTDVEAELLDLQRNWYLQNYTVAERSGADLPNVPTDDEVIIQRLQSLPNVIDMVFNKEVRAAIDFYTTGKRRALVEKLLALSLYYYPIFENILDREGLPLELKHLAVVESALNPNATSRAQAVGLWQFMDYTACDRQIGLEINSYVDERRDPIRSTEAAATYLKQLYKLFGDWHLAIAAYNCGPGTVNKAIRRAGGSDTVKKTFWDIFYFLPKETRAYVPSFIAVNYAMNFYEQHNLSRSLAVQPLVTDTIHISKRVHFDQIAAVLNIPIEEIRLLNPQYRRDEIPASTLRQYSLTLPSQQINSYIVLEDSILAYNADKYIHPSVVEPSNGSSVTSENGEYTIITKYYTTKKGDTYSKVARKFGVTIADIKRWNNLKGNTLKKGITIRIETRKKITPEDRDSNEPEVTTPEVVEKPEVAEKPEVVEKPEGVENHNPKKAETHVVARGETLASIAEQYGVTIAQLREWNDLKNDRIMAGQRLTVDGSKKKKTDNGNNNDKPKTHTVKSGETLSKIAEKYGVTISQLREWNNLKDDNIRVGDKLSISGKATSSASSSNSDNKQTYTVRRGDTLDKIAHSFGVTVDEIKEWNNIKGNNINAGQKLTIYSDKSTGKNSSSKDTPKKKTHTVKSGETLGKIAEKYGVGLSKLKKANGLKSDKISIGQKLIIP